MIKKITPDFIRQFLRKQRDKRGNITEFEFAKSGDVKQDIFNNYGYSGELANLFADNKDCVVHKWHHYIPLYDRYFAKYKGTPVRFLEIGVDRGGSLQMWRKYFGEQAIIFGIDINPECQRYDGQAGSVRIGSQIDKNFLSSVIAEMGGVDVILDDGSHSMKHIPVTLQNLFPKLNQSGIYMIEDLHTSYWKRFGGGYYSRANFFNLLRVLIDDMHHWYHKRDLKLPLIATDCSGIHIHDSIVVFEKNKVFKPVHSVNS